jgi:hypothetical protein
LTFVDLTTESDESNGIAIEVTQIVLRHDILEITFTADGVYDPERSIELANSIVMTSSPPQAPLQLIVGDSPNDIVGSKFRQAEKFDLSRLRNAYQAQTDVIIIVVGGQSVVYELR